MTIRTHQSIYGIYVIQIIQLPLSAIFTIVEFYLSTGAFLIQILSLVLEKTTEPLLPISKQVNRSSSSQHKLNTQMLSGAIICLEKSAPWTLMVPALSFPSLQKVFSLTLIDNLLLLIFQPLQMRLTCQNGSNLELVHLSASEINLCHSIRSLKGLSQFITVAPIWTLHKECKSLTISSKASQQPKYATKKAKMRQMTTTWQNSKSSNVSSKTTTTHFSSNSVSTRRRQHSKSRDS